MRLKFPQRIRHGAVIGLIVYIAMLGGATYGDTNIFLRTLQHLLLTGLVVGWLLNLIGHGREFPRTAVDAPICAYLIWLGVNILASGDPRVSLEQSWQIVMHILGLYLLVDIMRRGRERWIFEGVFLVAALVIAVSVVEILSWYFGLGFAGFTQGWFPIGGLRDPIPSELYRLSLAFNVATWLGNFVILVLPLTAAWALTARRKPDRQALVLVSVGLVWVLLFSVSRGAFLGMIALVGVWFGIRILKRIGIEGLNQQRVLLPLAIFFLFVVIGAGGIFSLSQRRSSGDEGRIVLWESALEMIRDHPAFGVGVHQYGYALRDYTALNNTTKHLQTAHNLYLNTTAEMGIPAVVIMAWLGVMFLRHWWRTWQKASTQQQLRLEAVLAALGGFCVQSLVDTFTYTSTVLPVLVMAAYVLHEETASRESRRMAVYGGLRYALLIAVVVFAGWILRVDLAQFRLFQGIVAILDEDYLTARAKVADAKALDSHLRLYDLQDAYLLGWLANENPDDYLDAAIEAYEAMLQTDPHFDIGHINLAALYAQRGDYEKAATAALRATEIRPDITSYWLELAEYEAASGDAESAEAHYRRALMASSLIPTNMRQPSGYLSGSEYWDADNPIHQAALEGVYAAYNPQQQLLFAINRNWSARADQAARDVQALGETAMNDFALGYYAAYKGDYETAAVWYERSRGLQDDVPWVYVQLAKVYFALGRYDDAEDAARTALFIDRTEGTAANYILAQLAEDDDRVNELLIQAVSPYVLVQAYDTTVFGHPAFLDYLPQVKAPGLGTAAYEPWLLLAQRYANDNDPETDPIEVYQAILADDPYVQAARDACGSPCQ